MTKKKVKAKIIFSPVTLEHEYDDKYISKDSLQYLLVDKAVNQLNRLQHKIEWIED